jgi:hypothetical protein
VRDPDLPLLRESLREAERVLDHQMGALQEVDYKAEQVLAVTLATTGGGLAFFAYASAKVDPGRSFGFVLVFAVGFAANVLAAAAFLSGYLGFVNPTVVQAGPAPAWIAQRTTIPRGRSGTTSVRSSRATRGTSPTTSGSSARSAHGRSAGSRCWPLRSSATRGLHFMVSERLASVVHGAKKPEKVEPAPPASIAKLRREPRPR